MSQAERILHILSLLSEKNEICTDKIAKYFNIKTRTIQRDISLLKSFLNNSLISTKKGCYKLIRISDIAEIFANIEDPEKINDFFDFLTFFDKEFLSIFKDKSFDFIKQFHKNTKEIYHIHENPIEKLPKSPTFEKIKKAIKHKNYINIEYFENYQRDLDRVKPLKIVYAKGNWYLASITQNYKMNNHFKFFRINFIRKITILKDTFKTDREAINFIHNFQSLFHGYQIETYEVILKVDKQVSRHFKVKKYLKSQTKLKEEDGDLYLSFQINNDMELLPLIKSWIPHIKVISPESLRKKLIYEIKTFLNDI